MNLRFFLIFFTLGIFLFSPPASSVVPLVTTRMKVKKAKGKMALVQVSTPLSEGETYYLTTSEPSSSSPVTNRGRRMGLTFDFSSLKTKSTTLEYNPSTFYLLFDYGWNMEQHEVGPILGYSAENSGFGGTTSSFILGAFYDYNFSENKDPLFSLFGIGTKLTYSAISPPGGTSLSSLTLYPNIFWKWFPFGTSVALRADFGYLYQKNQASASTEQLTTGLKSTAGLIFYF